MIVYQGTKAKFLHDCDHARIEDVVESAFVQKTGRYASHGEFKAWRHSLVEMARVLRDRTIPDDIGVGVEFGIPQTAKRIDFILSGQAEDGTPHLVIVELKQWSSARLSDKDGIIVANRGGKAETEGPHPSQTHHCPPTSCTLRAIRRANRQISQSTRRSSSKFPATGAPCSGSSASRRPAPPARLSPNPQAY